MKAMMVVLGGLVLLLPASVQAQDEDPGAAERAEAEAMGLEIPGNIDATAGMVGQGSLTGLKGVCVVVQDLDPMLEEQGLDKHRLYVKVALELVRGGLNIIPPERYEEFEDTAFLNVYIHSLNINGLTCAYNLGLSLSHDVTLARNPNIIIPATTWKSEELGVIEYGRLGDLVDSMKQKAGEFVDDYLAENAQE